MGTKRLHSVAHELMKTPANTLKARPPWCLQVPQGRQHPRVRRVHRRVAEVPRDRKGRTFLHLPSHFINIFAFWSFEQFFFWLQSFLLLCSCFQVGCRGPSSRAGAQQARGPDPSQNGRRTGSHKSNCVVRTQVKICK